MQRLLLTAIVALAPIVTAADTVGPEIAVGAPALDSIAAASDFVAALGLTHGYVMCAGHNVGGMQTALDGTPRLQTRMLYPLAPNDYIYQSSDALGDIVAVGDALYASYRRAGHVIVRQIESGREIDVDSGAPMSLTSNGAVLLATYNRAGGFYGAFLDMELHFVAPPFVIATLQSAYKPAVAAADGRFLLLDRSGDAWLIAPNGSTARVMTPAAAQFEVALASNGSSYFAVWCEKGRVVGKTLTGDAVTAMETVVIGEGDSIHRPAVAWDRTGYVATWIDHDDMYSRRLTPALAEPRLVAHIAAQGRVVSSSAGAFFCWRTLDGEVLTRQLDGSGTDNRINVGPTPQDEPAVTWDGDRMVVVWQEGDAIRAGRFTADGRALDGAGVVAASKNEPHSPRIAFDGVDYLLVWTEFISGKSQVFGRFVTREGTVRGEAFAISPLGQTYSATVVWIGSRYIVVWYGGAAAVTTNGVVTAVEPPTVDGDLSVHVTSGANETRIVMTSPAGTFVIATEPVGTSTDPHVHGYTLSSPRLVLHGEEVVVTWLRGTEYFGMISKEVWTAVLTPGGEVRVPPVELLDAGGWLAGSTAVWTLWDGRAFRFFISDGYTFRHGTLTWPLRFTELARTELFEPLGVADPVQIGTGRSAVAYSRYGVDLQSGEVSRRIYLRIIETSPPSPRRRSAGH